MSDDEYPMFIREVGEQELFDVLAEQLRLKGLSEAAAGYHALGIVRLKHEHLGTKPKRADVPKKGRRK